MFTVVKIPIPGTGSGGPGEANTGANVGAGSEVFQSKLGVALRFRTLLAGTNVSLVQSADEITINSTGGAGNPAASEEVLTFNLTAGEIAAGQINLVGTPAEPTEVKVDVIGGTSQEYGADYTVSGSILSWSSLGLETILETGDKLRVSYFV